MFAVACVSLGLIAVPQSSAATYLLVFVAGASAVGVQAVLWSYVATHYAASSRATALGITSGIGRLGAVAGPIVGGALVAAGAGLGGNVAVFSAAALVGAIAAVLVPKLIAQPTETQARPTVPAAAVGGQAGPVA